MFYTNSDFECVKTTRGLAEALNQSVDKGGRVIALMGAGLSRPSGIPLIFEIKNYLESCIALALEATPGSILNPSIPRLTGWPSFRELRERMSVDTSPLEQLKNAHASETDWRRRNLIDQAIGAISEWRTALQFLARLTVHTVDGLPELRLAEINQTVIDQLFWRLTVNRTPSLGHHMLAALAKKLRIDLILTPNFDTLIEEAFMKAEMAITPFDVHLTTGFPPADLVLDSQRPIIKMHGSNFGLRADFSLDGPPAHEDIENFCKYISGRKDLKESEVDVVARPVLLVAGIGGDDARISSLITKATLRFPKMRVFWFCYNATDKHKAARLGRAINTKEKIFSTVVTKDLGLQFLELYQILTHTLPSSNVIMPVVWNLPAAPIFLPSPINEPPAIEKLGPLHLEELKKKKVEVQACVDVAFRRSPKDCIPIVYIHSPAEVYGGPTLGSVLYDENIWGANRIWLDLDDISEPVGVFLRTSLAMKRLCGTQEPHSGLNLDLYESDIRAFQQMLVTEFGEIEQPTTSKWIVYLNAFNMPGRNSFVSQKSEKIRWSDNKSLHDFWTTLMFLSTAVPHLKIVWVVIVSANNLPIGADEESRKNFRHQPVYVTTNLVQFATTKIRDDVLDWLKQGDHDESVRRRALLELLLYDNLSRYPSAVVRTYINWLNRRNDRTGSEYKSVEARIYELVMMGCIREKPGGFLWMNLDIRKTLQQCLLEPTHVVRGFGARDRFDLRELLARAYGQLLMNSADPLAAFEALKHVFQAIRVAYNAGPSTYEVTATMQKQLDDGVQVFSKGDLRLVIAYGCTVFTTAKRLLDSRLTEQFSDRVLRDLQLEANFCARLIFALDADDMLLKASIVDLVCRVLRTRLVVFEMQGEYLRIVREIDNVLKSSDQDGKVGGTIYDLEVGRSRDWVTFQKWVWLYRAVAWQDLRCYGRALRNFSACLPRFECRGESPEETYQVLQRILEPVTRFGTTQNLDEIDALNGALSELSPTEVARRWLSATDILTLGEGSVLESDAAMTDSFEFVISYSRRLVYLLMHIDHACEMQEHYASTRGKMTSNNILSIAVWLIRFALSILRGHPTGDVLSTHFENTRLRAHLALVQGRMEARANLRLNMQTYGENIGGVFENFDRIETALADAEAYVDDFPIDFDSLSRGVIELRRAEIKLQRVSIFPSFREMREALTTCLTKDANASILRDHNSVTEQKVKNLVATLKDGISNASLDRSKYNDLLSSQVRILMDCERSLRRAERFLVQHPKSVWWWQILLILNLKLAEYMMSYGCLEVIVNGKHSALSKQLSSKSDQIVKQVRFQISRLSEQDPFQMARATESLGVYLWIRLVASALAAGSLSEPDRGTGCKRDSDLDKVLVELTGRLRRCSVAYDVRILEGGQERIETFPQVKKYIENILRVFDEQGEWFLGPIVVES